MKWLLVYLTVASSAPNGVGAIVMDNMPFNDLDSCTAFVNAVKNMPKWRDFKPVCAMNFAMAHEKAGWN